MSGEQFAGCVVLAVLGAGLVGVGLMGWKGSLEFALGGWTRDAATPESWRAAHITIGRWFVVAGVVGLASAGVVLAGTESAVGPIVVAGSVSLLVPVVVGVVKGTGRLERSTS